MKKLVLLLTVLGFSAFGQKAAFYAGPAIKYTQLTLKPGSASAVDFKYSYALGVQGSLFLKNKHEILLSCMYTDFSYNTTYHYYTGSPVPDKSVPLKSVNHYGYLAPSLGYHFHMNVREKHSVFFGLSAAPLWLINNNNKTTFQDNSVGKSDYATKKLFSVSPQLGYTFSPSQKMKFSLGLYYTVLSKVLDHTQFDPGYGYGVHISVLFKVGK